ncbi:hypothetical protein RIF29_05554 [Crotalaria pallida]|uniref:Uncharacterized protein n=1 Tax=Crotalaria pallida TaxID=3830 RepID=A0AAN9J4R1_CROPI
MHRRRRSSLQQRTESSNESTGSGASSSETKQEIESRSTTATSLGFAEEDERAVRDEVWLTVVVVDKRNIAKRVAVNIELVGSVSAIFLSPKESVGNAT